MITLYYAQKPFLETTETGIKTFGIAEQMKHLIERYNPTKTALLNHIKGQMWPGHVTSSFVSYSQEVDWTFKQLCYYGYIVYKPTKKLRWTDYPGGMFLLWLNDLFNITIELDGHLNNLCTETIDLQFRVEKRFSY